MVGEDDQRDKTKKSIDSTLCLSCSHSTNHANPRGVKNGPGASRAGASSGSLPGREEPGEVNRAWSVNVAAVASAAEGHRK